MTKSRPDSGDFIAAASSVVSRQLAVALGGGIPVRSTRHRRGHLETVGVGWARVTGWAIRRRQRPVRPAQAAGAGRHTGRVGLREQDRSPNLGRGPNAQMLGCPSFSR